MKMDYTNYEADKQISEKEIIIDTMESLRDEIIHCVSAGDYVTAERLSKEIESLILKINS